jgi:protein-S-isoprenylcysteine O-methyltransferase Ste14
MNNLRFGYLLVLIQFSCFAFFIFYCGIIPKQLGGKIIQFSAVLLGIVAIVLMRPGNFSIFPVPKQDAQLVTKGPYRLIRHPMYTAVLLFCFSLLLNRITVSSVAIFLVLLIDLVLKLHFEERLLLSLFPPYAAYMKKTWRLIPFIY